MEKHTDNVAAIRRAFEVLGYQTKTLDAVLATGDSILFYLYMSHAKHIISELRERNPETAPLSEFMGNGDEEKCEILRKGSSASYSVFYDHSLHQLD